MEYLLSSQDALLPNGGIVVRVGYSSDTYLPPHLYAGMEP